MYYNLRGKHVDEHMQYTFVAKLVSLLIHQRDL